MSYNSSSYTARSFSNWSLTTSPSLNEIYDFRGDYYVSLGAATGIKTTAGSTGTGSFSVSNNAYLGGIILALKPQICQYGTTTSSGITFTPVIDMASHVQQIPSTNFKTGQHFVMNVIKGLTYQVYTSNSPSYPLKMTVYEEGNAAGPVLAFSSSNTGNPGTSSSKDVFLSFTSPLSGQVRVMISRQADCSDNGTGNLTVNTNVSGGNNTQDDPSVAGSDTWIGQVYDGISFNNYIGYYNTTQYNGKTDEFQESFYPSGGPWPNINSDNSHGFNVSSNGAVRAQVLDETFSVHYRMKSTKSGFYTVTIASDDGVRLTVDNTKMFEYWNDHAPVAYDNQLISLSGSSSLQLDYYEQNAQNVVGFYNLTQIFSNALKTNTSQVLCKTSGAGSPISGDAIGALTAGITLVGYQWYYSTSADPTTRIKITTNGTGATFTPSPATFSNKVGVYYLYRVTTLRTANNIGINNPTNITNESNAATVRIKGCPNYWIGGAAPVSTTWNTSTDWNTASNWSDGVPYPGDDVEFASTANSGNANLDAKNNMVLDNDYVVGNFKNQSGKQLIIAPATSLTANGVITTTSNNNNQIYIQSSQSNPTLPSGSLIFHNTSAQPVNATVEMYTQAQYYPTPFKDNSTGLEYHYTWQYFGVPLTSVKADPTFYGSYLRRNDEASTNTLGKWISLGNADVLSPFVGYEITQVAPTTIVFQGTLVNNDKPIDLGYTPAAYDPGQNMLANPYTAAIDINKLTFASTTTVENTVYLYNTGSYAQWANNNGEGTNNSNSTLALAGQYIAIPKGQAGTGSIPADIPSMSAFMVKAISGPVSAGVTIKYNDVIIPNISAQRAPQSKTTITTDKTYMEITLNGSHLGDRMWLIDEPGTSHGFDNGWDGTKVVGSVGAPQLFAMEQSGNYQVNTSDNMNNTYLGFQAGVDVEDTLTFTHANIALKYDGLYLVDLVENKVVDISKSGTQYAFKSESTAAPVKRFKIVTEPYVKDAADLNTQIKVFNDNTSVFVDNQSNEKGELYFYDMMGRYLKKEIFGPSSISSFSMIPKSGAYVVKAVTASEKVSKRIIVNYQSE
ncbi:T9SS type A sorting domain-containing protein [Paludibacter propionicigenes]|nr:T9SS type A sorting domain-containing protein [Paludibacter propionicigenes]